MELVLIIKSSLVYVFSVLGNPLELAFLLGSVEENSLKLVAFSFLEGLPMKFIVLEASLIEEWIGMVFPIVGIGLVVSELSLVEWTIWKNIGSFSAGFSIVELSQENSSIAFVHFSIADGPSTLSGKSAT